MTQPATAMPATGHSPIPYSPDLEQQEKGEQETIQKLLETMRHISETVDKDQGHARRGAHAKGHGLLKGELTVLDQLPEILRQGLFAVPKTYSLVMRLSTAPGDMLDDKVSTPRGMAIKLVGVEGSRLSGSEGASTQDFVLVNGPAFLAPDAKTFLTNVKPLAASTDKAPGLKKVVSNVLQATEKVIETLGGESTKLKSMGGHPETNILGETFYSQVPLRFGDYVAKVSIAPVSPGLCALTDQPVDLDKNPDGLRAAVVDYFATQSAEWELRIQLCRDSIAMPIEDASVIWPEDISPYVTVARIRVEPQSAWSASRATAMEDGMAFNPWHGVEAHRPLGSIMRARKAVYDAVSNYRLSRTGHSIAEPRSFDTLPD